MIKEYLTATNQKDVNLIILKEAFITSYSRKKRTSEPKCLKKQGIRGLSRFLTLFGFCKAMKQLLKFWIFDLIRFGYLFISNQTFEVMYLTC